MCLLFLSTFCFSPNDSRSNTIKNVLKNIRIRKTMENISPKKLFSFLRYSNFCIFIFPSFFRNSHCFRGWFKKNLKVNDIIDCLNNFCLTHYVWYLERETSRDIEILSIDRKLNTEHFYGKIIYKICTKS